jgi:hypothetical protein
MTIEEEVAEIERKFSGLLQDPTGMKAGLEIGKHMGLRNFHIQEEMLAELKAIHMLLQRPAIVTHPIHLEPTTGGP